ncbi:MULTISPECIES: hypothetical protein [Paracoccaceae]|uniref:Uncharacterized protein n=1 Tax=Pseudogemmobacter humi TaxID=2483812 RepID=A0A3P5XQ83_9RHOB|nr:MULTISPECIES: hypothetical protein [Paracoccaceae]VDC33833.1 hypothetical protein XINFAN_04062 [Pseudogemmobacter humi]
MKHLLPLTACALIASTATALAEGNLPLGEWEVTAVRLQDPSQRITAIIENDPSYMGVVLSIADEAMAWRPNGSVPESTALEDCPGPIILPATESPDPIHIEPGAMAVLCGDGQAWGPGAVYLSPAPGVMELWWFDQSLLTLERVSK